MYNDYKYSYVDLLERANMTFLFVQRQRVLLMEVFKMYNKRGPLYLHDMLLYSQAPKSLFVTTPILYNVSVLVLCMV